MKRNNPYCDMALRKPNMLCFCVNCSEYRAEKEMMNTFDRMKNYIEDNEPY